jgi:DNA-directed RNA polymerase
MELKAALDSPDPHAYECALPVHQDGTCNGLQHYAALGGDARGAKQVNLDVTDRPSDVYTYVANMVEKRMQEDLERDPENKFPKILLGKIARKVVKQTVMTTVYGVTFVGAREQIEKQLKDRGDVPLEECYLAAAYLAKQVRRNSSFPSEKVLTCYFFQVLQCIGDLFQGANDIMNWLTACARIIAKSVPGDRVLEAVELDEASRSRKVKGVRTRLRKEQMAAVVWTTPLGLPIVQPYRKIKRKQIMTSMQSVYISDPNAPAEGELPFPERVL